MCKIKPSFIFTLMEILFQELKKKKIFNIALLGDLGTGKTYFVKQIIQFLAPNLLPEVSSPTFSYVHIYENKNFLFHHFDFYRITGEEKLLEIDLWQSLENSRAITLIEWADLFPTVLKDCNLHFRFFADKTNYTIKIEKNNITTINGK